jgi:hypothetical protein
MSFFMVGKYEVRAWEFGASGPNGYRVNGRWSITDPAVSDEPILEDECPIERSTVGEGVNDAMKAGREAAEALVAKDES